MVLRKQEATVGYHCPVCGCGVHSAVGVFALSGDMFRLKCSCGHSAMTVSYTRDRSIRLEVPCLVCPRPHVYTVSQKTFFDREFLSFACALSGLDVCYIGKEDRVEKAMRATEEKVAVMLEEAGITAETLGQKPDEDTDGDGSDADEYEPELNVPDNHVFDLVHFVVTDLAEEGKVFCRCEDGKGNYEVIPEPDGVRVTCTECGAQRHIDCSNSLFANSFFEMDSLTLE